MAAEAPLLGPRLGEPRVLQMKPPMKAQKMKAITAEMSVRRSAGDRYHWKSSIRWKVFFSLL